MLFAIALGGAAGSLARYGLEGLVQRGSTHFPYGTLVVNVSGSLLLGFLMHYLLQTSASPDIRAGLTIGLCGGFTTFSTFSYETVRLIEDGSYGRALAYVLASVVLSLLATYAGFAAARGLFTAAT
ncbi:MAG: fluoride efflux transporter CrcB [Gemmatimonadaceae bacterium]